MWGYAQMCVCIKHGVNFKGGKSHTKSAGCEWVQTGVSEKYVVMPHYEFVL